MQRLLFRDIASEPCIWLPLTILNNYSKLTSALPSLLRHNPESVLDLVAVAVTIVLPCTLYRQLYAISIGYGFVSSGHGCSSLGVTYETDGFDKNFFRCNILVWMPFGHLPLGSRLHRLETSYKN
jgi:hypothetical protein